MYSHIDVYLYNIYAHNMHHIPHIDTGQCFKNNIVASELPTSLLGPQTFVAAGAMVADGDWSMVRSGKLEPGSCLGRSAARNWRLAVSRPAFLLLGGPEWSTNWFWTSGLAAWCHWELQLVMLMGPVAKHLMVLSTWVWTCDCPWWTIQVRCFPLVYIPVTLAIIPPNAEILQSRCSILLGQFQRWSLHRRFLWYYS